MDPAVAATAATGAPAGVVFHDGLGERRHVVDAANETLEVLCLRGELTSVPSFEFALRERVSRLANFRHGYFARVRSVDRLNDQRSTLALVSDRTPGVRLSEILAVAELAHLAFDINAALCLIRQLVPAVAMLHENARDAAHGAISPERVIVGPNARLVIVEHVMGAALEQLRFSHERYWKDLRIALPRSAGQAHFDHRADITQVGVVALSLILGRPLRDDEYPMHVGEAVASAWAISAKGGLEPLPKGLRSWLSRALQLEARNSFTSALEARAELDKVLGDSDYIAAPTAVENFMAQYHAVVNPASRLKVEPSAPAGRVEPAPVPRVEPAPVPRVEPPAHKAEPAAPPKLKVEPAAPPKLKAEPVAQPKVDPPPQAPKPAFKAPELVLPLAASISNPIGEEEERDEIDDEADIEAQPSALAGRGRLVAAAAMLIVLAGGGALAARHYGMPSALGGVATGTLVVNTNPAGAQVVVDGEPRGVTPVTLTLKAGAHVVDVHGSGEPRSIPLTIAAGAQMSQYIDLPKTVAATGQLQIRSEPAGAQVAVDGVPRGVAPLTVADLTPGEHAVALTSDTGVTKQNVTIEAGITASLVVPLTSPESVPVSGWISVSAPVSVQLYENKRLLGSSETDRLMVTAGRHEIEIVSDVLGYRATRVVQVPPGKVAPIKIELPKGTMALNALPWAEVWIDGEKVGETPIGNLPVTIGPHEIVFRNPELGEQRHAATVTLNATARLSVDLRKK
jgi:hypothetical protein